MNLKSRKARLPIAALGACALATGGGVLAAGSAFAVGETLSFQGATGNAASIVAADPTTNATTRALSYGVRIAGLTGSSPVTLQVLSAPTSSTLYAEQVNGTGAPVADDSFATPTNGGAISLTAGSRTGTWTVTGATSAIPAGTLIKVGTEYYVTSAIVGAQGGAGTVSVSLTSPAQTTQSATLQTSGGLATATQVHVAATTATNPVLPGYVLGNNLYFGASTAGTYTFRVFSDVNTDGAYQANTDDSTPTFTLTVKSPADAFSLSSPSSIVAGTKASKATVTSSVDTSDIRGGTPSAALGAALANALVISVADDGTPINATASASTTAGATSQGVSALTTAIPVNSILLNSDNRYVGTVTTAASVGATTLAISGGTIRDVTSADVLHVGTGVGGENTGGNPTFTNTDGFYRLLSTDANTALTTGSGTPTTLTSALRFTGSSTVLGSTKTASIASNSVNTLALAAKAGQTTNLLTGSGTATVRVGTSDVTYTATATDSGGVLLANKDVTFTLTAGSGTTLADLKANDVAVPTTGASAGQVTVQTNSDGVATLKVTSTKTANTNAYTVAAVSGTASGTSITTTYATTAATTLTADNVTALVGGSATLSGKVVDQFGEPYSSSGLTAALAVSGGATPATGNYAINSEGKFSATVSDTASNTTARTDTFTWTVGGLSVSRSLAWRTSITPGAVTIATTTIAGSSSDTAIPFTSSTTRADIASSGAFTGDIETVKGSITDTATTPGALPFASVTYTGSDGVYFYNSDNKLSKTMTATATSTGKLSYDGTTDGIRVLFTKSGDATITAKSGTVSKSITVPVELATDAFKVIAIDEKGKPGTTVTLQGKVNDAFGNPASGRKVTLALSTLAAGNFSGTDADTVNAGFQVVTDDTGVWSTPFTSTSNQEGSVTLTATLWNAANTAPLTSNPTANAAYAAAGLTVDHGEYQDTATIKTGVEPLTLQASAHIAYGSKYYARGALLSGTGADANADVDIYAKVPGGTYALIDTVKADENGQYGVAEKISKSTYFLAKSGTASSSASATRVYSGVVLTANSSSKGKVTLSANGGPNAAVYLYFYRVYSNGDTGYVGRKLSTDFGNGSITVKAPSGNRKYKVLFQAPGTTAGDDTVSVRVK